MLSKVLEFIQSKSGTYLKDARLERIEAFVTSLVDSENYTLDSLYTTLKSQPLTHPLWRQIIQQITVGETYFFRNQAHFNALRQRVLPGMINQRRKQDQRFLRIWVAGCATGEEAYSIVMLLHELLPDIADWSIFILATDLNEASLTFARQGIYGKRAFRNETPVYLQGRWFNEVNGGYSIDPAIKRMVTFSQHNLVGTDYPALNNNTSSMDLILCRNVTIYFDRPTTHAVVNRFFDALRPDGWLLVGHSEPQPDVYDAFEMNVIGGAILYHKVMPQRQTPVVVLPKEQDYVEVPKIVPVAAPSKAIPPPVIVVPPAPPAVEVVLQQAYAAADREDWQTALKFLEIVEAQDRFNPLLHYIRGLVWTHNDESVNAIQSFRRAVYCEPSFALAHYALGELFYQRGDNAEALAAWHRAAKVLRDSHQDDVVLGASDLTVEMLNELVMYRLA